MHADPYFYYVSGYKSFVSDYTIFVSPIINGSNSCSSFYYYISNPGNHVIFSVNKDIFFHILFTENQNHKVIFFGFYAGWCKS